MDTNDKPAVGSNDELGPPLVEADMEALAAVAHQAGLDGIALKALARVLDAAQRIAVADERERLLSMPNLMHACDALGAPADGEHCDLLRRALCRA